MPPKMGPFCPLNPYHNCIMTYQASIMKESRSLHFTISCVFVSCSINVMSRFARIFSHITVVSHFRRPSRIMDLYHYRITAYLASMRWSIFCPYHSLYHAISSVFSHSLVSCPPLSSSPRKRIRPQRQNRILEDLLVTTLRNGQRLIRHDTHMIHT